MTDTSLHLLATLRRRAKSDRYQFVVRWMLGDGEDLPKEDDRFAIQVERAGRYLRPDGTFGAPGTEHTVEVAPRLDFMLEPPRDLRALPYPDATGPNGEVLRGWRVAVEPTKAVDCDAGSTDGQLPPGEGLGVCHLLTNVEPARVRWRAARLVAAALDRQQMRLTRQEPALARLAARADFVDRAAASFASYLVDGGPRPLDLPRVLPAEYARLLEVSQRLAAGSPESRAGQDALQAPLPRAFAISGASIGESWAAAAMLLSASTERDFLEQLDDTVEAPAQARQQVRLRSLQGGEILDYWGVSPQARGARQSASEVLGNGLTLGDFERTEIESWIAERLPIRFTAKHLPGAAARSARALRGEVKGAGHLARASDAGTFSEDDTMLVSGHLQTALDRGSAFPPPSPLGVRLDFDLQQSNTGPVGEQDPSTDGATFRHRTGDGLIGLIIRSALGPDDVRRVYSYNVYGMWEGHPASVEFFEHPDRQPSLEVLQPWLMTRRYAFEQDLREAFPDTAPGQVHPGLQDALENPPWQPILERPSEMVDLQDGGAVPLPNVVHGQDTLFTYDLRRGMGRGDLAPDGVFVGWDPAAPIAFDWHPGLDRDLKPIAEAEFDQPQRYRFWVTSVDPLDQESEPVPVASDDADANEPPTYLLTPRRRARLLPPPGNDPASETPTALFITPELDGERLSVHFESPLVNDTGGQQPDGPLADQRVAAEDLVAHVVLVRRRLTGAVDAPEARAQLARARAAANILQQPAWQERLDDLREEGYVLHEHRFGVEPPGSGQRWSVDFDLDTEGLGFEYLAAVQFAISEEKASRWMPDVVPDEALPGRRVQAVKANEEGYEVEILHLAETPRHSGVAVTPASPVPDPAPPRAIVRARANQGRHDLHRARPVLPPPGINRDLVLIKMLSRDVAAGDEPVPRREWTDTGVSLTHSQIAMLETALERTDPGTAERFEFQATELATVRHILAQELVETRAEGLRRSRTLGFRGLARLRWQYTPLAARSRVGEESEAVRFKVHSVRVPRQRQNAEAFASVSAEGERQGGRFRLSEVEEGAEGAWQAVSELAQPLAFCWYEDNGEQSPLFLARAGEDQDGRWLDVVPQTDASLSLPERARLLLFQGHPLAEVEVDDFEQTKDYELLLPVGGGGGETFAWWVGAVSAQGRESAPADRLLFTEQVGPTVEPAPAAFFQVGVPADVDRHRLKPSEHRPWLPTAIASDDDSRFSPRLVLSWDGFENDDEHLIAIERQERPIAAPSPAALRAQEEVDPWEALLAIESSPEGAALQRAEIDALRRGWLLGELVAIDDADLMEESFRIAPASAIPASEGLFRTSVLTASGEQERATFIDYLRHLGNLDLAMDGDWQYRYRLITVLDVGDETVPTAWRYLRSRPTEWAVWQQPETPEIEALQQGQEESVIEDVLPPRVIFRFDSGADPSRAVAPTSWLYRLVLRRRLESSLATTAASANEPVWIEVGQPASFKAGQSIDLVDDEIERTSWAEPLSLAYQLSVQQYRAADDEEELVRGQGGGDGGPATFSVEIPRPSRPEDREVEVVVPIRLR